MWITRQCLKQHASLPRNTQEWLAKSSVVEFSNKFDRFHFWTSTNPLTYLKKWAIWRTFWIYFSKIILLIIDGSYQKGFRPQWIACNWLDFILYSWTRHYCEWREIVVRLAPKRDLLRKHWRSISIDGTNIYLKSLGLFRTLQQTETSIYNRIVQEINMHTVLDVFMHIRIPKICTLYTAVCLLIKQIHNTMTR